MGTEDAFIQVLATFGFPAVLTGALWVAYNRLVQQLIEVVRNNTEAMARLSERISRLEREIDGLTEVTYGSQEMDAKSVLQEQRRVAPPTRCSGRPANP